MTRRKAPHPDLPLPNAESDDARAAFVARTADRFRATTQKILKRRNFRTSGQALSQAYTREVDVAVTTMFEHAAHEHHVDPDHLDLAVIALGGYGRRELAPFSDVDVLIACRQKTPAAEAVAETFVRMMWDAGFELGSQVESLLATETLLEDIDTKTALFENRYVCGDGAIARALERQVAHFRRQDRTDFIRRKISDSISRYEKFGNSFQLIEPNVKQSPGGMRDYQTLVWIGQVARERPGLTALRQKGLLLSGELKELNKAYDFLLRVRVELHLLTESKQDQLTVATQPDIAKSFGCRSRGDRLAVELFMRRYYEETRAIYRIYEDVVQALGLGENSEFLLGPKRVPRVGNTMTTRLYSHRLVREPLYVFRLQQEKGQRLDRALRRRMEVLRNRVLRGKKVIDRMRREFTDIMSSPRNLPRVVRTLHETQFLFKIIPAFSHLTCLKRYDLYHHYTVDEHSFKVLENIVALGEGHGDPRDELFVRLYSEIADKRPLFFAALLHDIGKIKGSGHAVNGAIMSRDILTKLFLPPEEIDTVCYLIEQHLLMSHFSQRRDTNDIDTLQAFCDLVPGRTMLKCLCLLTYADMRATSPLVWTEWKRTLLMDLYVKAYEFLERSSKQPESAYKAKKQELLDSFAAGAQRGSALKHLDTLPGGYILAATPETVRKHMELLGKLGKREVQVALSRGDAAIEITFFAHDDPFCLARFCGVLAINDFNILHANAFTTSEGIVIDVFYVEDMRQSETIEPERVAKLGRDATAAIRGELDLARAISQHRQKWRRVQRTDLPVASRVEFENDITDDATIIDIFAQDRLGLLYEITNALSRANLTIHRAHISTEANRAIDSFYVSDDRQKLKTAKSLDHLRESLRKVIADDEN